ncbi:MAG: PQQ-binding-like beta-propeller repeat protein [Vicinamibacterales bacterium]
MTKTLSVLLASFVLAIATLTAQSPAADWSQWRGPQRDGAAAFTPPATWPSALTKRWEIAVGAGHSSPVISGDVVVLHAREGEREVARALDVKSGRELWRNEYPAPYKMNPAAVGHGPGPKSTPVIGFGRVFTFGISGILSAYDFASGKLLWRVDAPPAPPEFGTAMSPVIDGNMLIAHVGGSDKGALTAFDAATGTVRWRWSGDGPAYASPVVAEIAGIKQIITQTQKFLVSVNAANGQLLWQLPFTTSFEQNSITPIVRGDAVIYSGLDNGTIAVRVIRKGAALATEPLWKNADVSMYMSSPVVSGTTLYGLSHKSRGQFFAIDLASGQTLWTTVGRQGENASLVTAGPLLLLSTTGSELIVARANPARFDELKRYTIADSAVWAHPAIAGRTIVVKDVDKLICWTI